MTEIQTGTVDLTVTSPPYFNAIDYTVHVNSLSEEGAKASKKDHNYRTRKQMSYETYLSFLEGCFTEVYRVHREGSFCCVVIATVLHQGRHYPLPMDFSSLMERIGWKFHQDIIWAKCTGGVKRAGSMIQHAAPGYYYPNMMTEYILIFRKPGDRKIYQARTKEEKEASRISINDLFKKELANNIWHIAPVPPNQARHPCCFPEEIPRRLITLYSYSKDLVLDPFMGHGTTLRVAKSLGRHAVGYEIEKEYCEYAIKHMSTLWNRKKQIIVKYESCKSEGLK